MEQKNIWTEQGLPESEADKEVHGFLALVAMCAAAPTTELRVSFCA